MKPRLNPWTFVFLVIGATCATALTILTLIDVIVKGSPWYYCVGLLLPAVVAVIWWVLIAKLIAYKENNNDEV